MNIKYPNLVNKPLDYSNGDNWMVKQSEGNCPVDVFYLYPTSSDPKCKQDVSPVDQYMKTTAYPQFERGPSCFFNVANIYAPYYRQLTPPAIGKCKTLDQLFDSVYNSEARTDAYAALDYYFEHYNNNKPFILAGHSQGSITLFHVLKEYMKLHPEYYSRMVCAYILGTTVNKEFLSGTEHIKFATSETDTGVVISWNSEGPGATMPNTLCLVKGALNCINPLNWKIDDTYAPISLNKGSFDPNKHLLVEGVADAQIDLNRMSVVTKTVASKGYKPLPKEWVAFGDQSYHHNDWDFFYSNIKENAIKRIKAYLNK